MTTDTTNTQTTTPAPQTKAEALAAERKVAREAKEAKKAATKAANAAKRENGIIATIRTALQRPAGATKAEVLAELVQKFPDRDPMGMSCTIGIQFSRLSKTLGKIENAKVANRGRVYGVKGTLVLPEVTTTAAPAPVTPEPAPVAAPVVENKPSAERDPREALQAAKSTTKKNGKKTK